MEIEKIVYKNLENGEVTNQITKSEDEETITLQATITIHKNKKSEMKKYEKACQKEFYPILWYTNEIRKFTKNEERKQIKDKQETIKSEEFLIN